MPLGASLSLWDAGGLSGKAGNMARQPQADFGSEALRALVVARRRRLVAAGALCVVAAAGTGALVWRSAIEGARSDLAREVLSLRAQYEAEQKAAPSSQEGGAAADHSQSMKLMAEFARAHPQDPAGWQMALQATAMAVEKKDWALAQELLGLVASRTRRFPVIQARVRRTLATILAGQGDYPGALAELELVAQLPENPVGEETKLLQAQLLHLSGNREKAADLLRDLGAQAVQGGPEASLFGHSAAAEAALWAGYWK